MPCLTSFLDAMWRPGQGMQDVQPMLLPAPAIKTAPWLSRGLMQM